MKHIALSTLMLIGAPVVAMAGGPATPTVEPQVTAQAPMMPAMQTGAWTGVYTGVKLGYGTSTTKGSSDDGKLHVAGLNLGYRQESGTIVYGAELGFERDDLNVGSGDRTIQNTGDLKLLVGKDLGQTLVYGTVGVARAKATINGDTGTDTGFSVGIGADYALNQQWTIGGELSAHRYNDFDNSGVRLSDTALAVKLGYKF